MLVSATAHRENIEGCCAPPRHGMRTWTSRAAQRHAQDSSAPSRALRGETQTASSSRRSPPRARVAAAVAASRRTEEADGRRVTTAPMGELALKMILGGLDRLYLKACPRIVGKEPQLVYQRIDAISIAMCYTWRCAPPVGDDRRVWWPPTFRVSQSRSSHGFPQGSRLREPDATDALDPPRKGAGHVCPDPSVRRSRRQSA